MKIGMLFGWPATKEFLETGTAAVTVELDWDEAMAEYASLLGKRVEDLSVDEQKQAWLNHVLARGEVKE